MHVHQAFLSFTVDEACSAQYRSLFDPIYISGVAPGAVCGVAATVGPGAFRGATAAMRPGAVSGLWGENGIAKEKRPYTWLDI